MIAVYILAVFVVLTLGIVAYLMFQDGFYPGAMVFGGLAGLLIFILVDDSISRKEIKNRIEMKVIVPANSELKTIFINENGDEISSKILRVGNLTK